MVQDPADFANFWVVELMCYVRTTPRPLRCAETCTTSRTCRRESPASPSEAIARGRPRLHPHSAPAQTASTTTTTTAAPDLVIHDTPTHDATCTSDGVAVGSIPCQLAKHEANLIVWATDSLWSMCHARWSDVIAVSCKLERLGRCDASWSDVVAVSCMLERRGRCVMQAVATDIALHLGWLVNLRGWLVSLRERGGRLHWRPVE